MNVIDRVKKNVSNLYEILLGTSIYKLSPYLNAA